MTSITASYGAARARGKAALLALLLFALSALPASAQPASAQPRLLILGDSLTAGYGLPRPDGFQPRLAAALAARGTQVRIIDAAVSGDTTAAARARLAWALADGADAAIVALGGNDGLRALDPRETEQNMTAILDTLAARGIPVLLSGMLAPPNLGPEYGAQFNAAFARLGARPDVLFDPFILEGVIDNPSLNQPDGMHPNAAGVARIVVRLTPLVERLLAKVPN